ncbi:alpha/beta hydrolase [Phormidium sp. LEGE 05292]|uniref:alpha/beta fold hydrolase n=1 Tax=[Phormidium] sp. LEGE 05292 TaxID=767427 RepID=UPI00188295BD|nr:alpha/beta hydrolase [Phormidium sp. LEGE 05292]MBE9227904.1 alpha/beta hydrolase [Phormidium sp. LEGE 05292]
MASINILGTAHAYELTAPTAKSDVLVFIHGWLLSRRYWQPLIELLAPSYQCLGYDLRGFGDSQIGQKNQNVVGSLEKSLVETVNAKAALYTPAVYANELGLLLKELNISSAWLVGHSLGGTIALWAAEQFPESVKGVICVNAGGGIYLKEAFEQFRSVGQQLVKFRPRILRYLPWIDLVFARDSVACPVARSWGRQRVIDFVMAHPQAALGTLLESTTEAEVNTLPKIVSQLQQPVYFIAGANDKVMEPKYVRHLASFHPLFECCGNNVIEIPDCGHLAMLEQPNVVAKEVSSILTRYESE